MKNKMAWYLSFLIAQIQTINFSFAAQGISKPSIGDYSEIVGMINSYGRLMAVFIVVLALASFVYNLIIVGTSSGNAAKRSDAISNMIMAGGVAAFIPFVGVILQFLMYLK